MERIDKIIPPRPKRSGLGVVPVRLDLANRGEGGDNTGLGVTISGDDSAEAQARLASVIRKILVLAKRIDNETL